jgi:hypothetical protein
MKMQFARSNASFMHAKLSHSDTAGTSLRQIKDRSSICFPWLFQTVATNSPFVDAAGKRNQENQVGWLNLRFLQWISFSPLFSLTPAKELCRAPSYGLGPVAFAQTSEGHFLGMPKLSRHFRIASTLDSKIKLLGINKFRYKNP